MLVIMYACLSGSPLLHYHLTFLLSCFHSDLKVHLSRHSGVICIAEAELIADRCPELAEEAMSIAVETCFRFSFVTSWIRLNTKYRTTPFWNNQVNEDWHAAAESQSVATLNRLNR